MIRKGLRNGKQIKTSPCFHPSFLRFSHRTDELGIRSAEAYFIPILRLETHFPNWGMRVLFKFKGKLCFLGATVHLYERSCPSVFRSVCPSVRLSVRPVLFSNDKYGRFLRLKSHPMNHNHNQWHNEWRWSNSIWCTPAVLVSFAVSLNRSSALEAHKSGRKVCFCVIHFNPEIVILPKFPPFHLFEVSLKGVKDGLQEKKEWEEILAQVWIFSISVQIDGYLLTSLVSNTGNVPFEFNHFYQIQIMIEK